MILLAGAQVAEGKTVGAPTAPSKALPELNSPGGFSHPGEATSGSLMFKDGETGRYIAAPALATDVEIHIAGSMARTRVRQRFTNPSKAADNRTWLEGIYVFPLPETGAVDRMRLRIGDRFIEGHIEERAAARKAYEAARATGRKAGLIEQERPNIFTTSLANLAPGESIAVEIEYQQTLTQDDGEYRLRFPMVVGPRYLPSALHLVGGKATDSKFAGGSPVADGHRITPPVIAPGPHPSRPGAETGRVNPVAITVHLDPGFPLGDVDSATHAIDLIRESSGKAMIAFANGETPANKDFELVWSPRAGAEPHATMYREAWRQNQYLMLSVMPPKSAGNSQNSWQETRQARELVLVIDVSGSMGGASIVQAKESLKLALGRLDPTDAFNIIAFNDSNWALYDGARPANRGNLLEAFRFVDNLEAGGGTEILAAMVRALGNAGADSRDDNNARLRQIIFVTDGSIGNEDEVFAAIEKHIGGSRLFTVGIGSAPNSHFMRRAARHGRGSFSHIGNPAQVSPRMKALLAKIERPVLTGIAVEWPHGWHVEAWPNPLPDLYHGEPVSLTARMPDDQPLSPGAKIIVSGQLAGKPWHLTLDLDQAREAKGVAALWAKNRITALEEARAQGADAEATKAEMLAVALGHEIVSRYTSLVAVDVTPSRTEDGTIVSREVPVMFPDGWTWDGVFGSPALESAAAAPRALKQAALRSLGKGAVLQTSRIILPQTATVAPRALLVGLIALAFGLALLLVSGFWRQASESFRP